ncbi:hypothetical protein [Leyella stercorea]|uniref:hypothetical protein n=1 Tax=Leyella stercorea TaxID=363265 RepID=UPI00242CCD43|nr:hypothetical protein [Leyella stercorea]
MEKRKVLSIAVLELLSNILADTTDGLTGTEIHRFLLQAGISDISENETFLAKRKRLFNAFANYGAQNEAYMSRSAEK